MGQLGVTPALSARHEYCLISLQGLQREVLFSMLVKEAPCSRGQLQDHGAAVQELKERTEQRLMRCSDNGIKTSLDWCYQQSKEKKLLGVCLCVCVCGGREEEYV